MSGSGSEAQSGSRDALDVRHSLAVVLADDYTKRKHVVRVTTATDEFLLQVTDIFSKNLRFQP